MAESWWSVMASAQLEPIDVEDALHVDLSTEACPVFAPPVPEDLEDSLPCAMVGRDGGVRTGMVMDTHNVTVSVWASTWEAAMREANRLSGAVARLPFEQGMKTQWRASSLTSLPFNAPDAAHPTIPRVQFTASVACRATS